MCRSEKRLMFRIKSLVFWIYLAVNLCIQSQHEKRRNKKTFTLNLFRQRPTGIYLFKVNNGNTVVMWKIYNKDTRTTLMGSFWCLFVNSEHNYTLLMCFHCWLWTNAGRANSIYYLKSAIKTLVQCLKQVITQSPQNRSILSL